MQFIARLFSTWRGMSARTHIIIGSVALGILLVMVGVFVFIRMQANQIDNTGLTDVPPITFEHTYEDGVHTISGTVTLRNRCQRFDASSFVDDSTTPITIRVDLTSEHDEGICLELPDTRTFSLEVEAPEGAQTAVYINGLPSTGAAL